MTELQKLSLKKLQKSRLPLFVLDRKSKRGGFVILNLKSYEELKKSQTPADYRAMGLLWDRLDLSNEDFHARLKDPGHVEHLWAGRRLLEYARSSVVKEILSLEEIREILSRVRLRPIFQEAWSRAVHYWTQNP